MQSTLWVSNEFIDKFKGARPCQYAGAVFLESCYFRCALTRFPLHLPSMTHLFSFPCLSDSLLPLFFHPSHPPSFFPFLSPCLLLRLLPCFPRSTNPLPTSPPQGQSSCDTPWRRLYWADHIQSLHIVSSHTTETADYNYSDSPPLVCGAGNSSCMELLGCSQWMVGEWMTFQS